jgi:hypothetical protein
MNVFISHSHADKEIVHRIAADLRRNGFTVWLDDDLVSPGEPWAEKLSYAVIQSDAVVVVISRNTSISQWQTSEIAMAISAKNSDSSKKVIPVLIDKGAEVPFFLKSLVYCDLTDDKAYAKNFDQFVQSIQKPKDLPHKIDDFNKFRMEHIKQQQSLLIQEKKALYQKQIMRTTAISTAIASSSIAATILSLGAFGSFNWGLLGANTFVGGVIAGVAATLIPLLVSWYFPKRTKSSEVGNGN